MVDIYDAALATAANMLKPRSQGGYGLDATFTVTTVGEYDPATGSSPITSTNYTGSAFRDSYKRQEIDGTRVLASDVKFLVSPVQSNGTAMPMLNPEYKLAFDGDTYTIVSVMPWKYAGLNVGFEVQGRK